MSSLEPQDKGHVAIGLGMACLTQILFFVIGLVVVSIVGLTKGAGFLFAGWGFTQWLGLVPLILHQRAKGHGNTVIGILITGFLGVLISSACAMMTLK